MWEKADELFAKSIEKAEKSDKSIAAPHILRQWGETFAERSNWDRAEACYQNALKLDQTRSAESLAVALNLSRLAMVARSRDVLGTAADNERRALAVREKLAPGSLAVASSQNSLGAIAVWRGEMAAAVEHLRQSLAIVERLSPGSPYLASVLNNLGVIT